MQQHLLLCTALLVHLVQEGWGLNEKRKKKKKSQKIYRIITEVKYVYTANTANLPTLFPVTNLHLKAESSGAVTCVIMCVCHEKRHAASVWLVCRHT